MRLILTVDLEDWYHCNYGGAESSQYIEQSRVVENGCRTLDILDQYGAEATFFVLGSVAAREPKLVRAIAAAGHEVACHSYSHRLVYQQMEATFQEETHRAKRLLEDLTGQEVVGYRAPSWSIARAEWKMLDNRNWALRILCEEGFLYDSSLCPVRNYLYGVRGAPRFPHKVSLVSGKSIWEIPLSSVDLLGTRIPFGGGFYFRVMPLCLTRALGRRHQKEGYPFVFYLHPRELDPHQPRLAIGLKEWLIHYCGLHSCRRKMERLLSDWKCMTMREYVQSLERDHRMEEHSVED